MSRAVTLLDHLALLVRAPPRHPERWRDAGPPIHLAGGAPPPDPGTTPAEVAASTGDEGESEPGMEGMLKGPYVAETFKVAVEDDYVVVEG